MTRNLIKGNYPIFETEANESGIVPVRRFGFKSDLDELLEIINRNLDEGDLGLACRNADIDESATAIYDFCKSCMERLCRDKVLTIDQLALERKYPMRDRAHCERLVTDIMMNLSR